MMGRFLAGNWPWLAGLLTSAVLGVLLLLARADRDTARAELLAANTLNATLSDKLTTQSDAVKAWKQAATANRDVYLAGLDAANRRAVRLEIQAADILNMPIPSDPHEACEVADRILEEVTK